MKTTFILAAVFVLGTLSACTFQMGLSTAAKGRVIIAASTAQKGPKTIVAKPAYSSGARSVGVAMRSATSPGARDLAAATQITSMSYTLFNMDSGGTQTDTGPIDKSNPNLDLTLNPGTNYRIVVDVVINSSAPGYSVGVTHYGDQADFLVDPNYDTYVSLTIHPTQAIVFDPASVVSGSTMSTIKYLDPASPPTTLPSQNFFAGPLTVSPSDRLFLGPDARLYYFNTNLSAVFPWPATNTAINSASAVLTSNILVTASATATTHLVSPTILAACADPVTADSLWVVVQDSNKYYYLALTGVSGAPTVTDENEITSTLTSAGTTVLVTGLAVDSTYSDVYLTYASTDNLSKLESGVLQYYNDLLESYSIRNSFADSSSSIYTDVVWEEGKAWALLSPNTTFSGITTPTNLLNKGTADLQAFDDFLSKLTGPKATVSNNSWTGNPAVTASGSTLGLPNRFTGPIQGSTLYLDQMDFTTKGTEKLTSVNLDALTNALTFYP